MYETFLFYFFKFEKTRVYVLCGVCFVVSGIGGKASIRVFAVAHFLLRKFTHKDVQKIIL